MYTKDSKKRLRQAREATDGSVEVLCFACRRTADTTKQVGLAAFFTKPAVTGGDELPQRRRAVIVWLSRAAADSAAAAVPASVY